MKILFLTDNFPPEVNAPATRTYEHCREWVKQGIDVTVISCVPNFPFGKPYKGYRNKLLQKEEKEGIKVIRVWSFMAPNKGFFIRVLDFMSFSFSAFIAGLFQKADIVMATSPQFFTALSGRALSFFKRKPFVLEIRDLWPEQVLASTSVKRNIIIRYFEWEALKCYRRADLIVAVTDSYVDRIASKGIDRNKFVVVKNGVDTAIYKPTPKNEALLKKYKLEGKFVAAYIGTHGISQNLSFVIEAISEFNKTSGHSEKVYFIFAGEGADKEKIKKKAGLSGIENITFIDQISKKDMPAYISVSDIALVPLRRSDLYLSVIPSKIFEFSAMNIPVLLGVDGEARRLVEAHNSGLYYTPEDQKSFLLQLNRLVNNDNDILPQLRQGSRKLAEKYDRKSLALKLIKSIKKLVSENLKD